MKRRKNKFQNNNLLLDLNNNDVKGNENTKKTKALISSSRVNHRFSSSAGDQLRFGHFLNLPIKPSSLPLDEDQSALLSTSMEQGNADAADEPHVGMILQVQQHPAEDDEGKKTKQVVQHYELVERIYEELGLLDEHVIDFAYQPVIRKKPNYEEGRCTSSKPSATAADSLLPLSESPNFYVPWYTQDFYERLGETAFAGGSHGEIWKARRRCDMLVARSGPCNDQEELIMKRLKVEQTGIMEAGLREVYFGQLLQHNTPPLLFTTYVDHFFIQKANKSQTELWIVFSNAGMSMRSYLYTPIDTGGFVVYQNSDFWRKLRLSVSSTTTTTTNNNKDDSYTSLSTTVVYNCNNSQNNNKRSSNNFNNPVLEKHGRFIMKEVLRQLLTSAAFLHGLGIVHRDIKPSNIMCKVASSLIGEDKSDYNSFVMFKSSNNGSTPTIQCVLGDFSSAWDKVTEERLYSDGMSANEQTLEYAPPEVLFGKKWIPFDENNPQSYDSWSIGVVALEMLLGTPNVFSIDQRTTAILTHRLEGRVSKLEIRRALYLSALSQFCIYTPNSGSRDGWYFRDSGEPLHDWTTTLKPTCSLQDFHDALRARDPLGLGFDSSADSLLELIWRLLAWNPSQRMTPAQALLHEYFRDQTPISSTKIKNVALVTSGYTVDTVDRTVLVKDKYAIPTVYTCPKCHRSFEDWSSCHLHANSRRHAKFCVYDTSSLPPCLSTHPMLPAHPTSGYCDIRGRRKSIEDFHSIRLQKSHQFYGVFDGHFGNLASKYAASKLYDELFLRLGDLKHILADRETWKSTVFSRVSDSFEVLHKRFLAVAKGGVMDQSGTTATILYMTEDGVVVGNVGDSRAILSVGASYNETATVSFLQLTVDHIPSLKLEQERIERLGGFVSAKEKGQIPRVNGTLAVSRSIGDASLAPLLSRTPHVLAFTRNEILRHCRPSLSYDNLEGVEQAQSENSAPTDDDREFPCFVVLASDGLWDVLSNQEVVDMVVDVIRNSQGNYFSLEEGGAFQEAAQRLTQEAYVRGSSDNIGVCVVAITFPLSLK